MEQPHNIPVDRPTPQPVKPVRHTHTLTLGLHCGCGHCGRLGGCGTIWVVTVLRLVVEISFNFKTFTFYVTHGFPKMTLSFGGYYNP